MASTTMVSMSRIVLAALRTSIVILTNRRSYFNTSQFSDNALGTPGKATRRFFSGPGLDN
jgi:hypothetical protein